MQATIFITSAQALTIAALSGVDEVGRDMLASSPKTDLRKAAGYYLNSESMRLAVLPEGSDVGLVLSPADEARYDRHCSFPSELRGCVFSGATGLPKDYERTLAWWSPLLVTADHDGAQHVQNLLNEYEVSETDVLLSNGVVLCIDHAMELIEGFRPDQYIEVRVPVMADMLGMERGLFDSDTTYSMSPNHPIERIFLRVRDIQNSPDPDFIAIAILHSENWDSPFYQ